MKKILFLTAFLIVLTTQVLAQKRTVYGYVFGLGGATGSISKVKITDMNTGEVYQQNELVGGYWGLGGIKYIKYELPVNHAYAIDVYSNGLGVRWRAFYLPAGSGSHKAPDVRF